MDASEPEQKRIKRITEYIEDEIVRAQHLPLEELIQHKAAMIHVLQFLNIEEAYAVSLASRRVYMWFQQNDIWYALAQRWLSPARLTQCEAWVEQVKPKGKRINYLWLLLGEFAQQRFEDGLRILSDIWVDGENIVRVDSYEGRVRLSLYGYHTVKFEDSVPGAEDFSIGIYYRQILSRASAVEIVYYVLSQRHGASMEFGSPWSRMYIRSKLGN